VRLRHGRTRAGIARRLQAPWWIVDAVDKRKARLNCIRHFLTQVPYQDLPRREIVLPEELLAGAHARRSGPAAMQVPEFY
jgi:lysozyme family protein